MHYVKMARRAHSHAREPALSVKGHGDTGRLSLSDLLLSEADQAALRSVLAAEPVAGQPLPVCDVLERLAALVRCDAIGAALTDPDGYVVDQVELPTRPQRDAERRRLRRSVPDRSRALDAGFRATPSASARTDCRTPWRSGSAPAGLASSQVWWDRRTGAFSARDVAVLTMIAPAVQRLVRDAATQALPAP